MLRIIAILLAFNTAAFAQVTRPNESLQEQLVPESFKFEASAVAAKINLFQWHTTVTYTLTNNSGMNLYAGIAMDSVSIGTCSRLASAAHAARGALQLLPVPGGGAYSVNVQAGPPRAAFVPAGARVTGALTLDECSAPNPGSPTAPLSLSLMISRSQDPRSMIQYPLSAEAPVRQIPE